MEFYKLCILTTFAYKLLLSHTTAEGAFVSWADSGRLDQIVHAQSDLGPRCSLPESLGTAQIVGVWKRSFQIAGLIWLVCIIPGTVGLTI